MTRRIISTLLAAALSVAIAAPSPAATDAYHRMVAKLHSLKSYQATVNARLTYGSVSGGQPTSMKWVDKVLYKSPNKLSVTFVGFMGGLKVVSDGRTMYTYSPLANQYSEHPAPANLLDSVLTTSTVGIRLKEVGSSSINGVPVSVLKGTTPTAQGNVDTTYYIRKSDNLPRRIIVTMHVSGPQGQSFRVVNEQDFATQKTNTTISNSAFRFTVPAGATKSPNLGGMSTGGGPAAGLPGLP